MAKHVYMSRLIKCILVTIYLICTFAALAQDTPVGTRLKVLQINAWHATTAVPGGFEGMVSIITQTDPDIVLLSESQSKDTRVIDQLVDTLNQLGKTYYGESSNRSAGLISKYEIKESGTCCASDVQGPMAKASIVVQGHTIVVYSAHLDYTHYACYLPRGYSGVTWKKLPAPVGDADSVLTANRLSQRDESIAAFILDAEAEIAKGHLVLLGGDFNEPSHLDWQADTKNLRDHNGLVVDWDCSVMLTSMGMVDTYREKFPDPVHYPGFTFPSANSAVAIDKLTWAPEADERDRIDFIYYHPNSAWSLETSFIVGPEETIVRSKVQPKDSHDRFIIPIGTWPTDHKANLATFLIQP